jgi:hypothetical protein
MRIGQPAEQRIAGRLVRSSASRLGRVKHADPPNLARLLRARRERPRSCSAAAKQKEFAPSYA